MTERYHITRRGKRVRAVAFVGTLSLASSGVAHIVPEATHAASVAISEADKGSGIDQNVQDFTKTYVVRPGDTIWGIASAEGQAVANNPERLYEQMQAIGSQIPKDQDGVLRVGEVVRLPGGSEIGKQS